MAMWMKYTLVGIGGAVIGSLGTIGIQKLCEKNVVKKTSKKAGAGDKKDGE